MALKIIYQGPNGAVAIDEQQNVTVSSNYTVQPTDYIVTATGAGSFNITLPSAVPNNGRAIVIKCLTTAAITVTAYTGEFIDTVTFKSLSNGETLDIVSDGIRWIDTVGSTISGTRIIDGTITNTKLSASSVTDTKIGTGAVTETKIGTGAVTETKIGTSAVTETKIGTSAVTETKIANNAVTAAKIATGAVGNDEISTSATPTVNTIYTNNWFRSNGSTGWYNETHGGGIFMEDSSYVKVYNSKAFMPSSGDGTNGIIFPLDPGGGSGDRASIKYYRIGTTGEITCFEMKVENDAEDYIRLTAPGGYVRVGFSNETKVYGSSQNGVVATNDSGSLTDWPSGWGGGLSTWDICASGIRYSSLSQRSDIRYKENIKTVESGLNQINQVRPVTFNWKKDVPFYSDPQIQYGFIAQEIEKIFPDLIQNDNNGYKSVSYNAFTPLLVKCIQEQQQQIQSLEERIKKLEELIKS
jgi:hypothetical protein